MEDVVAEELEEPDVDVAVDGPGEPDPEFEGAGASLSPCLPATAKARHDTNRISFRRIRRLCQGPRAR